MVAKRCVVNVYPGGTRDTAILTKSSSNTTKLLERQMRHILEKIPESAVTLHSSTYERRIKSVKKYTFPSVHFLRDIKKCGLTFPLGHFIEIFIEEANRRFPSKFWTKFRIYKNRKILGIPGNENDWSYPDRGYFLGMANHLATFMLIAMDRVSRKRFYNQFPDAPVKIRGIFGNDDCDIAIVPKGECRWDCELVLHYAKLYREEHASTLSSFGVWYNSKKSFLSHESLFFEEYSAPGFSFKESRYAMIMANCIALKELRLAKHMLHSFLASCESLNEAVLSPMVDYAISILGIEFDAHEGKRDYYLGGWISKRSMHLSNVLYDTLDTETDPRYLSRIFDYVWGVQNLAKEHPIEVKSSSDNYHPLLRSMGISGKPPSHLASIVSTREGKDRFYSKLIDFERKPNGYRTLIRGLWNKVQKKSYNCSMLELQSLIASKIDCNIPQELVKEYTTANSELSVVNSTWIGFNELDMPNRTIKSLCYEVAKGTLVSELELPIRDSWEYSSYEFKNGLPEYTSDYPFVPIAKGGVRNVSSDGFCSLANHAVKYGRFPKSLLLTLPERKFPIWREDDNLLQKTVFSIEEFENTLWGEEPNLSFIGIETLLPKEEEPELEEALEPPKEEEPIFEESEEEEYILTQEKKPFTVHDWVSLSMFPEIANQFVDKRCELHSSNELRLPDITMLDYECLACAIVAHNPQDPNHNSREVVEDSRTWMPRDDLLRLLGFDDVESVDLFDGSGDEGFGFDF
jgi:hypothetical protein